MWVTSSPRRCFFERFRRCITKPKLLIWPEIVCCSVTGLRVELRSLKQLIRIAAQSSNSHQAHIRVPSALFANSTSSSRTRAAKYRRRVSERKMLAALNHLTEAETMTARIKDACHAEESHGAIRDVRTPSRISGKRVTPPWNENTRKPRPSRASSRNLLPKIDSAIKFPG